MRGQALTLQRRSCRPFLHDGSRQFQGRDEKGDTAWCMKHMEEAHTATSGHLSSSWGKVVEMRLSAKIRYKSSSGASTFNAPATRWPDFAPACRLSHLCLL